MRHWIRAAAVLLLLVPTASVSPAAASGTTGRRVFDEGDWVAPIVSGPDQAQLDRTAGALDDDPLGLVPKLPFVQRYSLDTDHWEVWLCGDTGYTMSGAIADLKAATVDYFDDLSGGRYGISFSAGGTSTDTNCINGLSTGAIATIGKPEGVIVIDPVTGGGYASPGLICSGTGNCDDIPDTFPGSGRFAVIGAPALRGFPSIATHEIGHALQWPHSNSGQSEYDNPIDLMSGNLTIDGWTEPESYSTLAFNRYQSGWIAPDDVTFATPVYQQLTLQPFTGSGTQMVVVPTATNGVFYTLGARVTSPNDPIPRQWQGVEVYKIDHDCGEPAFSGLCPGIWRNQYPEPPNPGGVEHVLQVGEGITLDGIRIEVIGRDGDGYVLAAGDPNNSLPFFDIAASQFVDDILWLADAGITKGCNPPSNSQFCPKNTVTRGEMAAFLVRALGLTDNGGGNTFTDDDGSIFENDIAKLAAAGITKGCNPPDNDMFCPNDRVTREQMAAFMVRAYDLTDDGGGNTFIDDDNSVFQADIAKLAAAAITKGCNPPDNTKFCPYQAVTREQMAAFLHRASTG